MEHIVDPLRNPDNWHKLKLDCGTYAWVYWPDNLPTVEIMVQECLCCGPETVDAVEYPHDPWEESATGVV